MNDHPLNDPRPPNSEREESKKIARTILNFVKLGSWSCSWMHAHIFCAPDSNRSIVYSHKSVPKDGKKYSTIRRIHWKCLMNESSWAFIIVVWRYVDHVAVIYLQLINDFARVTGWHNCSCTFIFADFWIRVRDAACPFLFLWLKYPNINYLRRGSCVRVVVWCCVGLMLGHW